MSVELISHNNNYDFQVIDEFLSEYSEAQSEIENLLIALENNPNEPDLLNDLFRKIHSIKGNSHFLGLHVMTDFIHSLETVLDKLRNGELAYSKSLGDVILKAIDQIGNYVHSAKNSKTTNVQLDNILQGDLKRVPGAEITSVSDKHEQDIYTDILKAGQVSTDNSDEQRKKDLLLFAEIIEKAEQRSPLWKGRTERVLSMARDLNSESGYKVDPMQLEAAIYLHDLGMVMLPFEQTNRSSELTNTDKQSMKLHPNMGASLIAENPNWQQASDIILQHHEREDGNGYPMGLKGDNICDGAKILAIAGTIESIVSRRSDNGDKYPVIHAIREINKNGGSQFSPYWVSIFNRVIRGKTKAN